MPNTPVTHQEWWDFKHTAYKIAGCCIGFMLVIAVAVVFVGWRTSVIVEKQRQESIDRQVASCESANDFRSTFRNILKQVAEQGTGEPLDLTALAGFDSLDPASQTYFRSLSTLIASGGPNERLLAIRAGYIKDFPLVDCVALKAELEKDHA